MKKLYTKKEIVYYVNKEKDAKELQSILYDKHEDVGVYYNGKDECKVIVHC